MDYTENYFDECEPRAIPAPAVISKCLTSPSVPEVSLIFGKPLDKVPQHTKNRDSPLETKKRQSYVDWKKDGLLTSTNFVTREASSTRMSPISGLSQRNTISDRFLERASDTNCTNNRHDSSPNRESREINRNNTLAVGTESNFDGARNSKEFISQNYSPGFRPQTPTQRKTEKNYTESPLHRNFQSPSRTNGENSSWNPSGDRNSSPEAYLPRNNPPRSSAGNYAAICDSRQSQPRCRHRPIERRDESTIQDLLMLVKNQNVQIKSLQTQVERLLQSHERNMDYMEHQRNQISQPVRSKSQPPPEDAQQEFRYAGDSLRNAIVAKKVSIGVMTSFELSVKNNPFVETQNNENWRGSAPPARKIVPGPLENINEDSESHPSVFSKMSSNNTRLSSSGTLGSRSSDKIGDTQSSAEKTRRYSPILGNKRANNDDNPQIVFPEKSALPTQELDLSNDEVNRLTTKNVSKNHEKGANNYYQHTNDANAFDRTNGGNFPDKYLEKTEFTDLGYYPGAETQSEVASQKNPAEGTFHLRRSDLKVVDGPPPSPDPSIHVEMREYSSDDENEQQNNHTPGIGWTFYKNVVGQVNRILHTIPDSREEDSYEKKNAEIPRNEEQNNGDILDSVKLATLEQLRMLGVSFAESPENHGENTHKKVMFDSSYCSPMDFQGNISTHPTSSSTDSNISMEMKTLALKYLSDEQLADVAINKNGQRQTTMKQKYFRIQGTNMSSATINYLQRYCLMSGVNQYTDGRGRGSIIAQRKLKHLVMTEELVAQPVTRNPTNEHQTFDDMSNVGRSDNILDITTLKKQPKLL